VTWAGGGAGPRKGLLKGCRGVGAGPVALAGQKERVEREELGRGEGARRLGWACTWWRKERKKKNKREV